MNQLTITTEESNRISEIFVDCGMPQRHRQEIRAIIDRLSARVEDLEEWKESGTVVIKGAQCEIKVLQSNLSSLLSAVEPFQLSLKKMESKSSGVSEPDEMPISGFGRSIHDVPTMGDLRHLSTVAAGIRGGKV